MVIVVNLATGERLYYGGIKPSNAVAAAYAQAQGDWNTWDYRAKYKSMLKFGNLTVACGDFVARRESKGTT